MDYKKKYDAFFSKTIKKIEHSVIDYVIFSKQNKKNPNMVLNTIIDFLYKREQQLKNKISSRYPEVFLKYNSRFNEYEGDYLNNFFLYDFKNASSALKGNPQKISAQLSVFEAFYTARVNFPNSRRFLELAYDLNKHFDKYNLDFQNENNNPIYSEIFKEMEKERFPPRKNSVIKVAPPNEKIKMSEKIKISDILDKEEKFLLLNLMLFWNQSNEETRKRLTGKKGRITSTEFIRLHALTEGVIDDELFFEKQLDKNTNYRKINDGPRGNRRVKIPLILSAISKIEKINLPIMETLLNDELLKIQKQE